jgi:SAM-dependent methyltransferase
MRTSSEDLAAFYASPLGQKASAVVRQKLTDAWGDGGGLRIAGIGYTTPFLRVFSKSERVISLAPQGAGAIAGGREVLIEDERLPLRDASVDRLLLFHALEEASDPRRLLREAWRVLADDGRLIVAVANRHGLWTLFENSPLAAGRAFSRRQLTQLLGSVFFAPTAQASALYFPPTARLLPLAPLWERTAERLEPLAIPLPNIAGLVLTEARRSLAVPASGSKAEVLAPIFGGARRPAAAAERRPAARDKR